MPKHKNCQKSYEVFEEFMDRCLKNDYSLIWPDKKVWTLDNLDKIKRNFIDRSIEGKGNFFENIYQQFSDLNDDCWRILADSFFVYTLPSTYMSPEKKYEYIKKVSDKRQLDLPDFSNDIWDVLNQGFTRTTIQYHQKYKQLWLILLFAMRVKRKEDREEFINDHNSVRHELSEIMENMDPGDRAYGMYNAMLHMGYPEKYERIISNQDKKKIVNYYEERIGEGLKEEGTIDEKILSIRKSFEKEEYQDRDFDFYNSEVKSDWREEDAELEEGDEDRGDTVEEDPLLDDLVTALWRNKQIILYGPPGTGKTYYANKLAKAVIAQDNFEKDYSQLNQEEKRALQLAQEAEESPRYLWFCAFHPAYGYEDFIEGYRPEITETGEAAFKLKDGIFKKMCETAKKDPQNSYVLIIDEINRGDIPRIFGELITLIEPEKRWHRDKDQKTEVYLSASEDPFDVPENVFIIGTMNTADKSIALLDTALRRRFGFRELMPMPELLDKKEINGVNLGRWLREVNRRISLEVGRNLQIGHSYLMKKGKPIKSEEELLASFKDKILPLLQEYCYEDYNTLEEILGSKIVDKDRGRFEPRVFSSGATDLIIETMNNMINGEEDSE